MLKSYIGQSSARPIALWLTQPWYGPPTWSTWFMQSPLTSFYRTNSTITRINYTTVYRRKTGEILSMITDRWKL